MRRAERLFQIIQILRRSRAPVTADAIAAELETSKRSVYRDIAALVGQRAPIRGEAGVGYVLEAGFDMPPLMLTPDEIEAAVLGAQWVAGRGDPVLAKAASDLISKIAAAVPDRLRPYVLEPAIGAAPAWNPQTDRIDVAQVRAWIHAGRKIRLDYSDGAGAVSARVIWPVTVGYRETIRMIIAWCELRQAFRSFRTDRVVGADFLEERHGKRPAVLRGEWIKFRDAEIAAWKAKERAGCGA
ncbi:MULTISPECIES: YafY family protein [unclassified Caulobacter]|uniref:helix-turn-helix transcriptional regulator n=1 Tax=unclassified Caulobacter TaxID=2648921 RepID=UPI0006FA4C0B|nr:MULTISPECIES: YafY family protein [unclassified Caulobacter]KQV58497.1 DNA-binding protein [Caulobacter sp. Root342]KQV68994.1 DNA-binding protein [Caulobacter sp. Root343]